MCLCTATFSLYSMSTAAIKATSSVTNDRICQQKLYMYYATIIYASFPANATIKAAR